MKDSNRPELVVLGLVLLACIPFLGAIIDGGFVADDVFLLRDNPHLEEPRSLHTALLQPLWNLHRPEDPPQKAYYRPVVGLAFFGARAIGGGEAWPYHLLNVVIHGAATLALWRWLRARCADPLAIGAAALFAFHPAHVEAVTWISGIADPLVALFLFLALAAYDGARRRGRSLSWTACAFFLFALASKEFALVFPLLVVALDLIDRRELPLAGAMRRWLPLIAILAVYYGVRAGIVYGSASAGFASEDDLGLTAVREALLRLEVIGQGALHCFFPIELDAYREIDPAGPSIARVALGVIFLIGIAWLLGKGTHVQRIAAVLLATGVALAVAPGSLGRFPYAERFWYFPSAGACVLVADLLLALVHSPARRAIAFGILALLCTVRIGTRNADYASEETFLRHSLEASPDSPQVLADLIQLQLRRVHAGVPLAEADARLAEAERWAEHLLSLTATRIVTNNDLVPVQRLAALQARRRESPR